MSSVEERKIQAKKPGGDKSKEGRGVLTSQLSTTSSIWQPPLDPSSNEIIQQIRDVNKDVDTPIQFIRGVNDIVCATIPINFFVVLIILFNTGEIVTGVNYLEDCPLENRIPVFLLVGGCFGLLKALHVLAVNIRLRKHSSFTSDKTILDRDQRTADIVDSALNIFLIAWQITGTYWTFSIWYPRFEAPLHQPNEWCSQFVYVFALVQTGCFAALVSIMCMFYFCLFAYYRYTNLLYQ